MPRALTQFAGQVVGRMFIDRRAYGHGQKVVWLARCLDCGHEQEYAHDSLVNLAGVCRRTGKPPRCRRCAAQGRPNLGLVRARLVRLGQSPAGRNAEIVDAARAGERYETIAGRFAITKQRVGQIVKEFGGSNREEHHGLDRGGQVADPPAAAEAAEAPGAVRGDPEPRPEGP